MAKIIDLRKKTTELASAEPSENMEGQLVSTSYSHAHPHASFPEPMSEHIVSHEEHLEAPEHIQPHDHFSGDLISWSGHISAHEPKLGMVIGTIGVLLVAAVWGIFHNNIVGSILFVLLAAMLGHHFYADRETGYFELNHKGVWAHNKFHAYHDIESFWIDYHPHINVKELSLHLKKRHMPYLKIPLHDQNPVQIRQLMLDFIPEIPHHDGFAEIMARKLGL